MSFAVFADICKRWVRFIVSCLQSESALVRFVARSVVFANNEFLVEMRHYAIYDMVGSFFVEELS